MIQQSFIKKYGGVYFLFTPDNCGFFLQNIFTTVHMESTAYVESSPTHSPTLYSSPNLQNIFTTTKMESALTSIPPPNLNLKKNLKINYHVMVFDTSTILDIINKKKYENMYENMLSFSVK